MPPPLPTIQEQDRLDKVQDEKDARRAKTEAKSSQKTPVESAEVRGSQSDLNALEQGLADLSEAGSVRSWSLTESDGPISVTVVLAPAEPQ